MPIKNDNEEKHIIAAANSLLGDFGEEFTMDQLEAIAGVSRSSIYRRVGNKKAILAHLARLQGKQYEPPDVKQNILQSAYSVFSRHGLSAVTMEQIAETADVGVATVYRHFGDKETLVHAFVETMSPRSDIRNLAMNPGNGDLSDLEAVVTNVLTFFYDNRDFIRLVFMGNESDRRYLEELRKDSDSSLGHLARYFKKQKRSGRLKSQGSPDELALSLIGMVFAFTVLGPLSFNTELQDPRRISRLIVSCFFCEQEEQKP